VGGGGVPDGCEVEEGDGEDGLDLVVEESEGEAFLVSVGTEDLVSVVEVILNCRFNIYTIQEKYKE
jgi:hypothetical protein